MKWQGSLLLIPLLACQAPAQQPQPAVPTPPTQAPAPVEPLASSPLTVPGPADPCTSPPIQFPGPADAGRDRRSGNHNFANFINWMSNPLANIDPRAVTAIYPIFGSEWVSTNPPFPKSDFQLYGPPITIALSDRFAMGLNQGGYAAAHFSRNPIDRQRLIALDPLGQFRDIHE